MPEERQDAIPIPSLWRPARSVFEGIRYEHLVSGIAGGAIAAQMLHPLDLIRIRFSVNDGSLSTRNLNYNGISEAVRRIVQSEGFKGLYRGASAGTLGAGVSWGLYFLIYNAAKYQFRGSELDKQLKPSTHLACAALTGVLTLSLTNPIFVVKTRLCLAAPMSHSGTISYSSVFDGLWKLVRYEGVRGMYKGFVPGLFGVSHGAIQFMTYEELKKLYCNYYHIPITSKLTNTTYLILASSSKIFAVVTTFPYKVIKSRLMQENAAKYNGIHDLMMKTYRYEGWRGFYKGLVPNMIRVTPSVCITFVIYENLSRRLLQRQL